ncbi:DNA repair protein RecO [Defluviimonas sp. SAOS-178_SWC]|uniref:DNA repair protein RecO n=1 Tax=Defluviimonas sp. SAOS-178_SWC TaxID=3121287 RepID=UPI003221B4D9
MDWRDEGALLTVRQHGETSAIVEVFTAAHGRHAGVVRGGASRKVAPLLQPGAQLDLTWRARLDDHIGTFTVEPLRSRAGVLSDRLALAALNSVCALLHATLPEREPHPGLYTATVGLLDSLGAPTAWVLAYLRWELMLLEELGYGLDLTSCAVTGSREDLAYVSPKSGRAVARGAAGQWADRLLPLPPCLLGQGPADPVELAAGMTTTGYFLEHRLFPDLGTRPLPEARRRFAAMVARQG